MNLFLITSLISSCAFPTTVFHTIIIVKVVSKGIIYSKLLQKGMKSLTALKKELLDLSDTNPNSHKTTISTPSLLAIGFAPMTWPCLGIDRIKSVIFSYDCPGHFAY